MKGEIWNDGILKIERKAEAGYTTGLCPRYESKNCGDWCILFGEPYVKAVDNGMRRKRVIYLELCHRSLMFESLEDRRGLAQRGSGEESI